MRNLPNYRSTFRATFAAIIVSMFTINDTIAKPILSIYEAVDNYEVTAQDSDDASIKYWQAKVDKQSGCIFFFRDYTDPGNGTTDYMGTNSGYNRKCSLLQFYGRGGQAFSRNNPLAQLENRLTFELAPDASAFTITYTEDENMSDYFQGSYGSGDTALTPGDLLSTIAVTMRPPTSEGTNWDWSIVQRNVSDHDIDPRVWAVQSVRSNILASIPRTMSANADDINGLWNPAAPKSFHRRTIDTNSLNLTVGREFTVDYRYDVETLSAGNNSSVSSWAGFEYIQYNAPFTSDQGKPLKAGTTRYDVGQLRININAPITGSVPTADAGADQSHIINTIDPANVTLDASGSTDSDGSIVSYTWTDILGNPIATGQTVNLDLPEGDYYYTLIVEDNDGNITTDEVNVKVTFEWDYTLYDAWPGRDPADPNQLVNLYNQNITRPVIKDLVWPANHGETDVCLYLDDKFAAVSLTIDDNTVPNHDWWIEQANRHNFEVTWFVIVGSHRLNSGNGYFGTWEVFQQNIIDNGQEVQSHTVSHAGDDDVRPADEMHWEYSYSRALIDENLTNNTCLTIAYPSGNARPSIAAEYYIAGRGTVGGVNQPHATNYLNTNAGSLAAIPRLLSTTDIYSRGWINPLWHLIQTDDLPNWETQLADAASNPELWFGSYTNVAKYAQQRDTATVTVTNVTANEIKFDLTDRMFDPVFDYPLTIKVRVNNTWTDPVATQSGQPIDATLIEHQGNKYVLVNAIPDRGQVTLSDGVAAPTVINRAIFYNNSSFDNNDPAANANDDNAITTDKQALLPGQTATFNNYTSYDKGINGLIIDIPALPNPVSASDFTFKVGNDSTPAAWSTAPAPTSITTRPGQGINGSDRITIIFPDGVITKQWLQVTILANTNTSLAVKDIFYFGNAIGETGNAATDTIVDATDEVESRNHPRHFMNPAPIDYPYDHNRDGKVDATDEIIVRNNTTDFTNDLELITP